MPFHATFWNIDNKIKQYYAAIIYGTLIVMFTHNLHTYQYLKIIKAGLG